MRLALAYLAAGVAAAIFGAALGTVAAMAYLYLEEQRR